MEWVETTGPTIEAARDAALDQLGVDERDVEVVVVAEPRSGLFGIGRVEARVRARVRPAVPRPKRSPRRRGDDRGRGRGERRSGDAEPTGAEQERDAGRSTSRRRRGRGPGDRPTTGEERGGSAPVATSAGSEEKVGADGAAGERRPAGSTRRRRPGSGTGDGRRRGGEGETVEVERSGGAVEEAEMTIEEQASTAERFVAGVVERFGFDHATTTARIDGDHVVVDVTGDALGLLIGPRGRTLDALQELARTVVQRHGDEGSARIVVDVAGFRAKRTAALETFVRRIAAEVVEKGEPQALEAMSAADRKIVHDTVTTIEGVHTTSEGVEPHRYVVLHPGSTDEDRAGVHNA